MEGGGRAEVEEGVEVFCTLSFFFSFEPTLAFSFRLPSVSFALSAQPRPRRASESVPPIRQRDEKDRGRKREREKERLC